MRGTLTKTRQHRPIVEADHRPSLEGLIGDILDKAAQKISRALRRRIVEEVDHALWQFNELEVSGESEAASLDETRGKHVYPVDESMRGRRDRPRQDGLAGEEQAGFFLARRGRVRAAGRANSAKTRRVLPCPFPGCEKTGKGPGLGWFCDEHGALPREVRDRIRLEEHAKSALALLAETGKDPQSILFRLRRSVLLLEGPLSLQTSGRKPRAILPCPYPGCGRPGKGPRFGWFCEEHRSLPKTERDRIRIAQRVKAALALIEQRKENATPIVAEAQRFDERRQYCRKPLVAQVDCRWGERSFQAVANDISEGGVFIATDVSLPIGAAIVLQAQLPGGLQLQANGVVRWTRSNAAAPGCGVQFESVPFEAAALIRHYVSNSDAQPIAN